MKFINSFFFTAGAMKTTNGYGCVLCHKRFITPDFLARHMAMHEKAKTKIETGTNNKDTCGGIETKTTGPSNRKADGAQSLKSGTVKIPMKTKGESCTICGKTFNSRAAVVVHRSVCHVNGIKCEYCAKIFSTGSLLKSHQWKAHKDNAGHLCSICGRVFRRKSDVKSHQRIIHGGEKPHLCKECGKSFARSKDLVEHTRTHTGEKPYKCTLCPATFSSSSSFSSHKKRHRMTPFACTKCPKRFSEKKLLDLHLEWHENKAVFSCEMCDKTFFRQRSLVTHVREKHMNVSDGILHPSTVSEQILHPCTLCDKVFSRKFNLDCHMRSHLGTHPYSCQLCKKSYTNKAHYACHMRGHGLNIYDCDQCDQSFPFDSDLQIHKKSAHGTNPLGKEYTCTVCNIDFQTSFRYKRHRLVHTGERNYLCDTCGKGFKSRSELVQHEKRHCDVRPFVCPQCGKSFKNNGNVTAHMKLHVGHQQRLFACSFCCKFFNQKSELIAHELSHHLKTESEETDPEVRMAEESSDVSGLTPPVKSIVETLLGGASVVQLVPKKTDTSATNPEGDTSITEVLPEGTSMIEMMPRDTIIRIMLAKTKKVKPMSKETKLVEVLAEKNAALEMETMEKETDIIGVIPQKVDVDRVMAKVEPEQLKAEDVMPDPVNEVILDQSLGTSDFTTSTDTTSPSATGTFSTNVVTDTGPATVIGFIHDM